MTDKQQIEDIAMELYNNQDKIDVTNPYEVAELIYNAGYRKVDENAVVLTQEEYDALLAKLERYKNKKAWAVTKEVCEEYRKETAKDFIFKVESYLGYNDDNDTFTKKELLLILAEVAKEQFGVEVEDNGN